MKTLLYLLFPVLFVPCLAAQQPLEDSQAGALVDCGNEKVAIFGRTESGDGRFALGWTIRPNRKKDPVDWSTYDRNRPLEFLETFLPDEEDSSKDPSKSNYLMVDGVLDLRKKTFTALPSKDPYFPNYNRHGIDAVWSDEQAGTRYAVVGNDGRFSTIDLFLVSLGAGPAKVVNLSPEADKAVAERMRKRDPKDYREYSTTYSFEGAGDPGKPSRPTFQKDALTIRFETAVPKSEVNSDAGTITFALPKGGVLRLDFDKK